MLTCITILPRLVLDKINSLLEICKKSRQTGHDNNGG
jgi:hypothetical protein